MIQKTDADFAWEKTAQLLAIDSPSGFTDRAAAWVRGEFEKLGFSAFVTAKGGVLADLGGSDGQDALLLEAHADTLGGMVAQIKSSGCLKLTNLGGMNANNAETENVRVYTRSGKVYEGTCQLHDPSIHVNGGYNDAKRSWDSVEIVLDENVSSSDETRALGIEVGDPAGPGQIPEGQRHHPRPPGVRPHHGVRGGGPRRLRQRAPGRHRGYLRGHGLRG